MYENLDAAQQYCDQNNPNCGHDSILRHVVLAFDEMHTKGRFAVIYTTNELVGVHRDRDVFERSVI